MIRVGNPKQEYLRISGDLVIANNTLTEKEFMIERLC